MSMKGFEPVTLSWGGQAFTVPAERQLQLIAQIEDALSGATGEQAVAVLMRPNGPPYSRLAAAFGGALRYAGAQVTDDEIYMSIVEALAEQNGDVMLDVRNAVLALLAIIAPPVALSLAAPASAKKKKTAKG